MTPRYPGRRLTGCLAALGLIAALFAAASAAPAEVYLFSFFRGNGETGVYLASSEDGYRFTALNGDKPIFVPPAWENQNLTRDPSIIYRDGKFRMVWTTNWRGRVFGYAESTDLRNWSAPVMVRPFPESLPEEDQPENVWAPEIHWDPAQRNYLILWSTTTAREKNNDDGSSNDGKKGSLDHRIYACRTNDGKTFTKAELFFDQGFSVIDAFLHIDDRGTRATADDRWVMVVKHEQNPEKNLRLTFAPLNLRGGWEKIGPSIAGPGSSVQPTKKAEGAAMLRQGNRWLLYWDAFSDGHYSMASSEDLVNWTDETPKLVMPPKPRHGTIFRAPKSAVGF